MPNSGGMTKLTVFIDSGKLPSASLARGKARGRAKAKAAAERAIRCAPYGARRRLAARAGRSRAPACAAATQVPIELSTVIQSTICTCVVRQDLGMLFAIMEMFGDNADVQARCCLALAVMWAVSSDDNCVMAHDADAIIIAVVVAAMCRHCDNKAVLEPACWALARMCLNNSSNQAKAASTCAIQAVLAALSAHPADEDLQESGCWALACMSYNNGDNQRKLGSTRAVRAVFAAICEHPNDMNVLESASFALRCMCPADDTADDKAKKPADAHTLNRETVFVLLAYIACIRTRMKMDTWKHCIIQWMMMIQMLRLYML
jgi:hypothetical protein